MRPCCCAEVTAVTAPRWLNAKPKAAVRMATRGATQTRGLERLAHVHASPRKDADRSNDGQLNRRHHGLRAGNSSRQELGLQNADWQARRLGAVPQAARSGYAGESSIGGAGTFAGFTT